MQFAPVPVTIGNVATAFLTEADEPELLELHPAASKAGRGCRNDPYLRLRLNIYTHSSWLNDACPMAAAIRCDLRQVERTCQEYLEELRGHEPVAPRSRAGNSLTAARQMAGQLRLPGPHDS